MIKSLLARIWRKPKPEVTPALEAVNHLAPAEWARGSSYLVKEQKANFSLEIFASLVKGMCTDCHRPEAFPCESIGCDGCTLLCPCKGCKEIRAQGLCLTMSSPEEIRQEHVLQTTPILWISSHGEDSISPSGLEVMAEIIGRFLKKSKNAVVLLDGVEYMIVTSGFIPVLRFLRDVQEGMILNSGILILPVNPAALQEREMALIGRNMREVVAPK
jgi:hypothetical protein